MIRNLLSAGVLSLGTMFVTSTQADEAGHRAAVEKLFTTMNMAESHKATINKMLDAQAQANPAMAAMRGVLEPFLNKHMGWDSVKEDLVKIYAEAFTDEDLEAIEKFYQTSAGKKALQQMPALTAKAMQAAQQKMQAHMPELQAALQAEAQKKGLPGAGPAGGATPRKPNQ